MAAGAELEVDEEMHGRGVVVDAGGEEGVDDDWVDEEHVGGGEGSVVKSVDGMAGTVVQTALKWRSVFSEYH